MVVKLDRQTWSSTIAIGRVMSGGGGGHISLASGVGQQSDRNQENIFQGRDY